MSKLFFYKSVVNPGNLIIGYKSLKIDKISSVLFRNSYMYIKNPYVAEVKYNKPYMHTSYVHIGPIIVPQYYYEDYTLYEFKFNEYNNIQESIDMLKEYKNITVINNVKKK